MDEFFKKKNLVIRAGLVTLIFLSACSVSPTQDPLKNTKHLVTQGHKSLYENGAFHVPNTTIRLIPPGPNAMEFAGELLGISARQSLTTSLKNASQSFSVVSVGTEKTFEVSKAIYKGGKDFSSWVTEHSRPGSMLLLNRAAPDAKYIFGASWQSAQEISRVLANGGDSLADDSVLLAKEINQKGVKVSEDILDDALRLSSSSLSGGMKGGAKALVRAKNDFIEGYVALPQKLTGHAQNMSVQDSWQNYMKGVEATGIWRESISDDMSFYVKDATSHYFSNVQDSFEKSQQEFEGASDTGSFAILKSLGWVLNGVLWQGMVKPVAQISAGSLGYMAVNGVVYPVVLAGKGAASLTELAVKVSWNSAHMAYEIVAPTGKAALSGLLAVAQSGGGALGSGVAITAGTAISGVAYTGTKIASATVAAGGYSAGKTIKYVGVPIATSGLVLAGATASVAVAATEVTGGGLIGASGEVVSATVQVGSVASSGVTLTAGTSASVVAGAGYGVYQLSKAVVVPTGYTLSSGVVLGYGSLSQIAGHSILAVSDASYMVLSMEGPNWVVYSVKGVLGQGDDLAPGTVLNLEKMQSQGEEFSKLPISAPELDNVIDTLPEDLAPKTF